MASQSFRNLCFTLNNYTVAEVEQIKSWDYKYLVFGYEICPTTKTPHLQGYVEWGRSVRWSTIQKLNPKIHWENRKGNAQQASNYCKKEGNYFEDGVLSNQGMRNDLTKIKNDILCGKSVDDIIMEDPILYHQYGRTLQKLEDIILRQKFRTVEPECKWLYGPTGSGKSSIWREQYDPNTMYLWRNDNGWWDGYKGQKFIIIDEFRGQIPYSELLSICSGQPHFLRRRNREPVPCLAEKVLITSSMRPEEVYNHLALEDSLDQLYRRIDVAEVVRGNTKP